MGPGKLTSDAINSARTFWRWDLGLSVVEPLRDVTQLDVLGLLRELLVARTETALRVPLDLQQVVVKAWVWLQTGLPLCSS